jgi:hypothetical protein
MSRLAFVAALLILATAFVGEAQAILDYKCDALSYPSCCPNGQVVGNDWAGRAYVCTPDGGLPP